MSKLLCRIPQSAVWLMSKLRLVARFVIPLWSWLVGDLRCVYVIRK